VTVVVCLLVLPQNQGASAWGWLHNLTLTQIYTHAPQAYGLTQTWSLCTELAFYLILPALGAALLQVGAASARLGLLVLAGGTALSAAWLASVASDGPLDPQVAGQWLPAYGSWFGAGMALAVWSVAAEQDCPGLRWVIDLARSPLSSWAVAGSAFVVATSSLAGPRSLEAAPTAAALLVKNVLYAVVAGFLVLPFVFGDRQQGTIGAVLASRPLRALGEISYSMFLWHLLVLETVVRVLDQPLFTGSFSVTFLLTLAGTLVVATASYWLVERPLFRLRHMTPGRTRAVTSAQDSAAATSS
jgi:peptidoglycan/LPS O-acetylase OafA/YrhL